MWRGKNPIAHHAWFMVEPPLLLMATGKHGLSRNAIITPCQSANVCGMTFARVQPSPHVIRGRVRAMGRLRLLPTKKLNWP